MKNPVANSRVWLFLLLGLPGVLLAKPVKVFVLAGQSNMEGHAKIETLAYLAEDPATAPLLKKMVGPDGSPRVSEDVWISYFTGRGEDNGEGFGPLTAGYGSRRVPGEDGGKIGPEYTFGITMGEAFEEPVVLIKTAWGGKSLFHDFRPPSAGPYERTEKDRERDRYSEERTGHYYRLMMDHVGAVLGDLGRVCPEYREKDGYEVAGFVWFQGWNDMVNRDVYPVGSAQGGKNRFAGYTELLGHFIRDVRRDLKAPELPFVIGVMGVGGHDPHETNQAFRQAMAATAELPGFAQNVRAVPTAPFWDEQLGAIARKNDEVKRMAYLLRTENKNEANRDGTMTKAEQKAYVENFRAELISHEEQGTWERGASNAGYHYLGCGKTFARMGAAFAEAILELRSGS